jgi:hypothetical protein
MRKTIPLYLLLLLLSGCIQQAALGPLEERPRVDLIVVDSLTPSWAHAQVKSPDRILILEEHQTSVGLVAHELCHVVQWINLGGRFTIEYGTQYALFGYEDMPLEVECQGLEDDPWYREWAGLVIEDRVLGVD